MDAIPEAWLSDWLGEELSKIRECYDIATDDIVEALEDELAVYRELKAIEDADEDDDPDEDYHSSAE